MSWSSGKDSALALERVLADERYQVEALLTTVTDEYERVSMHGVRLELLERQAASLDLELVQLRIPKQSNNAEYENRMEKMLLRHQERGVESVVFGDIFLEDLREYRESKLAQIGMHGIFPLWKDDTHQLANHLIKSGYRAVVTCVDGEVLTEDFAGREYNQQFLADLPKGIDLCGENGEFHTFVYSGPIFKHPIKITQGLKVLRESRFWYCDFSLR